MNPIVNPIINVIIIKILFIGEIINICSGIKSQVSKDPDVIPNSLSVKMGIRDS